MATVFMFGRRCGSTPVASFTTFAVSSHGRRRDVGHTDVTAFGRRIGMPDRVKFAAGKPHRRGTTKMIVSPAAFDAVLFEAARCRHCAAPEPTTTVGIGGRQIVLTILMYLGRTADSPLCLSCDSPRRYHYPEERPTLIGEVLVTDWSLRPGSRWNWSSWP